MGLPNPKNAGLGGAGLGLGAAGDLGLAALLNPDLLDTSEDEKKKNLQAARERMGLTGDSVYGGEASKLLGLPGAI